MRDWERVREKKGKIPWGSAGGSTKWWALSTGAEAEQFAFSDLWWGAIGRAMMTTTSSLQRRDRPWVIGFGFGLRIRDFFIFDKHLCALCLVCWVLCVWFAFVLGFDLSASDDATWWDSARRQRRDRFNFWLYIYIYFFFFFFGWESVGLLWASYL